MPSAYSTSKRRTVSNTRNAQRQPFNLLADFETREQAALEANQAREKEIRNMYANILNQGQGAARAAGLSEIARGERQAYGQGMQNLISSGLFGTTTAAALPMQTGRIATEQRLKLEDVLQQRQEQTQKELAGFIERIEQPYPDYGMLMQAMAAGSSTGGVQPSTRTPNPYSIYTLNL